MLNPKTINVMLSDYIAAACDLADAMEIQINDVKSKKLPDPSIGGVLEEARVFLLACKAKLMDAGLVVGQFELENEAKKSK